MTDRERLLGEIYRRERTIRGYFSARMVAPQDLDDLTQEVFCRIYESLDRFRGESTLSTWIYSICRHVLYDFNRKKARFLSVEVPEIPIDDGLEKVELEILVEALPSYLRHVYERKYRRGMKIREIAEDLSLPEGTVKYYLFQIRERLKAIYLPLRERYT